MGGGGGTKCCNSIGSSRARRFGGFHACFLSDKAVFRSLLIASSFVTLVAVNSRQKGGGAGNGAREIGGGDAIAQTRCLRCLICSKLSKSKRRIETKKDVDLECACLSLKVEAGTIFPIRVLWAPIGVVPWWKRSVH